MVVQQQELLVEEQARTRFGGHAGNAGLTWTMILLWLRERTKNWHLPNEKIIVRGL